jgi:hypothetical protein
MAGSPPIGMLSITPAATCGRDATIPARSTGDTYGKPCAIPNLTRFVPPHGETGLGLGMVFCPVGYNNSGQTIVARRNVHLHRETIMGYVPSD